MAGTDPVQASGATRLGSYEIMRLLARGGMAELFLAQSVGPEGFAKLVVLKKILPQFASNKRFVSAFLDEARLAATLDHPHIAHVYDMGTVGGDYFFTMEYVHGQDVRSLMRRAEEKGTKMPIDLVVLIASTVAGALHYAHEQRGADGSSLAIVHRDVSPSNVLISYDGTVKLVDFGVAKAATSSAKTRTGSIKGKIAYMSPEQAKGFPIDRRSDVFSLGIVMWEMVTGGRLYKEENDLQAIQKIVNSSPQPPTQLRTECPPELERIIMRALAKNQDDRYQTAEQLQLELEELAREHKLGQSSIALRSHIHTLFESELRAWQEAQAHGTSLAHYVTMHPELTSPLAGSDLYSIDEDEDIEYPTRAVPTTPRILRPDGTPMPIMQWSAQNPWPQVATASVATPVRSLVHRRDLWIVAGAAVAAAVIMGIIAGRSSKPAPAADTVRMQATPSPEAVAPPPTPAPAPAPAPTPTVPEVAPAPAPVADVAPAKPSKPSHGSTHGSTHQKKPSKPTTKPTKQPTAPAFDPNDPLPPRR